MTALNAADAIYVGSLAVDAIYRGSTMVWPTAAPAVPFSQDVLRLPGTLDGGRVYNGAAIIHPNVWSVADNDVYVAWVNSLREAIVAHWNGTTWTARALWTGVTDDSHNTMQVARTGDGRVHVSGDTHREALKLRSSDDFTTFTVRTITGLSADISYPSFVRDGDDLLLFCRDGAPGSAGTWVARYDAATQTWGTAFELVDGETSSLSPYFWRVTNRGGVIRMFWTWRQASPLENIDLCYAESVDGGTTWRNSSGTTYALPITPATAEVAYDGAGWINQGGSDVDSNGNPHAVILDDDGTDSAVIHVWHNGTTWQSEQVATWETLNWHSGISNYAAARPAVICPAAGGTKLVYRRNAESGLRAMDISTPGTPGTSTLLLDYQFGHFEPTFDPVAHEDHDTLRLLVTPSQEGGSGVQWDARYGYILTTPLTDIANEVPLHDDALAAAVPASGPFAWARCWDDSTVIEDSAGNNHVGTWSGVALSQASLLVDGAGKSVSFDGTNDYGELADDGAFDGLTAFTAFGVIKTNTTALRMIASRDKSGTADRSFQFRVSATGKLEFIKTQGTIVSVASTASVNTNVPVAVGATYDGTTIRLYVNGVEDGTVAASGGLGTMNLPLAIGHSQNSSGARQSFYLGGLQELMFYSRALSGTEMADLAAAAL